MLAVLAGGLSCTTSAFALVLEPGVGVGLEYTDNAALTPDRKDSDLIAIGYVGASVAEASGPVRVSAKSSLSYYHYTENTFGDRNYFNLGGNADWDMIRNRFVWQVQDYFTQQPIDTLNADTPNNTQNTNAFTVGPAIYFPLSGRQTFTLRPGYRNFSYERTNTDNQQYNLLASWVYRMYRTLDVGVDGGVTRVRYDNQQLYPGYTTSNVLLTLSGKRAHSDYKVSLGETSINMERSQNLTGLTGNLAWTIDFTGHDSIRAYVASELTDSSTNLLNASVRPENGDFSNEQISGDVLRNSTIRVTYARQGSTLSANFWGELRKLDYKNTPQDQDVNTLGAKLDYRMSALLSSGVYGSYSHVKQTDIGRTDQYYVLGGKLSYNLSRDLRSVLDIRYRKKDSTLGTVEYAEFSVLVNLVYGFGDVQRAIGLTR